MEKRIKRITEYLGLGLVGMLLAFSCHITVLAADLDKVGNLDNVYTDGIYQYQILDADGKEVQVGRGNDPQYGAQQTAFYKGNIQETVVIPDFVTIDGESYAVTEISCYAFYNCKKIKNLTIGENVRTIQLSAFKYCSGLEKIDWNAVSVDDFTTNNAYAFAGAGSTADGICLTFGDKVERIPAKAFFSQETSQGVGCCKKIKEIKFGSHVKEIGAYAFAHSELLEAVTLPEMLETVSEGSFANCSALKEITFPDQIKKIEKNAFKGCTSLKCLSFGKGLTSIANDCFAGCKKLEKIDWNVAAYDAFPDNNGIFYQAGQDSENGIFVTFGHNVEKVPDNMFYSKTGMASSDYVHVKKVVFEKTSQEQEVRIGGNAFRGCRDLAQITIGEQVTGIGAGAFSGCSGVTSLQLDAVSLADFTPGNDIFDGLGNAGSGVTLTVGKQVERIPAYFLAPNASTYGKTVNLKNLVFSERTDQKTCTIGKAAFRGITGIVSLQPDGVSAMEDQAFYGCTGLKEIYLPAGLEKIGAEVFKGIGTTQSAACDVYNGTELELTGGTEYNGSYFRIYSPLTVESEHGSYTLSGAQLKEYDGRQYVLGGKEVQVAVTPVSQVDDAWTVQDVTCNGESFAKMSVSGRQVIYKGTIPTGKAVLQIVYTEKKEPYAAAIGKEGYDSLADALAAAATGDCIRLLQDVCLTQTLTVTKDITLDGASHSLSRSTAVKMLLISAGKVVLRDMTLDGAGKSASVIEADGGTLLLGEDTFVTGCGVTSSSGNALYINGGAVVLDGGKLYANKGYDGGAVSVAKGSFTVKNGWITDNTAARNGGGIYQGKNGVVSLQGGSVTGNRCGGSYHGGGIYMASAAEISLQGNVLVSENNRGSGSTADNIYLNSGSIQLTGALSESAGIGVTAAVWPADDALIKFTKNAKNFAAHAEQFEPDSEKYYTEYAADGEIVIKQGKMQIVFDTCGGYLKDGQQSVYEEWRGTELSSVYACMTGENAPVKEDEPCVFAGWYDENGKLFTADTVVTKNLVFTARWVYGTCQTPVIQVTEGNRQLSEAELQTERLEPVTVNLQSGQDGAEIYYTLDGSDPAAEESGILYTEPFVLKKSAEIRAVAKAAQFFDSETVEQTISLQYVESVTVTGDASVYPGETVTMQAEVLTGDASVSGAVCWEIISAHTSGTIISDKGVLTVSPDEAEKQLEIQAASVVNPDKNDVWTVSVIPWKHVSYEVNCEGVDAPVDTEGYKTGDTVVLKDPPARDGFVFDGWSLQGADAKRYMAGAHYTIGDADCIFTAQWIRKEVKGVTVYKPEDIEKTPVTEIQAVKGSRISLEASVEQTGGLSENVTWVLEQAEKAETKLIVEENDPNCVSLQIAPGETAGKLLLVCRAQADETKQVQVGITLYNRCFTISYAAGDPDADGTMQEVRVEEGSRVQLAECGYTLQGHRFAGWRYKDGTIYQPDDSVTVEDEDIGLTALWIRQYVLVYDANGADRGSVAESGKSYDDAQKADVVGAELLSKEGYTFLRWNTKADGTGDAYEPGQKIVMDKDVTLYAQWKKNVVAVTAVKLVAEETTVEQGKTLILTAQILPETAENQVVSWRVKGQQAAGTKIASAGGQKAVLTVDAAETAQKLTIQVFSNENIKIQDTLEITVTRPNENGGSTDNGNGGGSSGGSTDNGNGGGNSGGSTDSGNSGGSTDNGNGGGNSGGSTDGGNGGGNSGGSTDNGNGGGNSGGSIDNGNGGGNSSGSTDNGNDEKPDREEAVRKGMTYKVGKYKYRVLSTAAHTVECVGTNSAKLKSVTIPDTIKLAGKTYKVVAVKKHAFAKMKKLQKVVIGKNVTQIGQKAFFKCSSLKLIQLKTTKLKKVGSGAFSGIHAKAVIRVPAKKLKTYQRLLKNKGQKKSVKIKK